MTKFDEIDNIRCFTKYDAISTSVLLTAEKKVQSFLVCCRLYRYFEHFHDRQSLKIYFTIS